MSDRSDMPIVVPLPLPEEPPKLSGTERRTQARFPLAASAEVFDLRSETRVRGRCSDLSTGGCYVDTMSPLSVGSTVNVRIVRGSGEFEASAVVSYAHPSMGMGLAFTEIKPEQRKILRSWIAELSGQKFEEPASVATPPAPVTVAAAPTPAAPEATALDVGANVRIVLNELITLLVRKRMITEDEGMALLRQMLR